MKGNEDLARSIIPVSSDASGFSRGTRAPEPSPPSSPKSSAGTFSPNHRATSAAFWPLTPPAEWSSWPTSSCPAHKLTRGDLKVLSVWALAQGGSPWDEAEGIHFGDCAVYQGHASYVAKTGAASQG